MEIDLDTAHMVWQYWVGNSLDSVRIQYIQPNHLPRPEAYGALDAMWLRSMEESDQPAAKILVFDDTGEELGGLGRGYDDRSLGEQAMSFMKNMDRWLARQMRAN